MRGKWCAQEFPYARARRGIPTVFPRQGPKKCLTRLLSRTDACKMPPAIATAFEYSTSLAPGSRLYSGSDGTDIEVNWFLA